MPSAERSRACTRAHRGSSAVLIADLTVMVAPHPEVNLVPTGDTIGAVDPACAPILAVAIAGTMGDMNVAPYVVACVIFVLGGAAVSAPAPAASTDRYAHSEET